ncbi:4733_t:CDS:2 [Cetraspora pellucida]|uniref:4733_t:CDS:1 n=1 Tax=Cetraspora pellucida TaxID=1433469 RepID=A0A9N8WKQ3_9GLOM|nr:4733_t:CDS:2 [Cetraspora pellucida]
MNRLINNDTNRKRVASCPQCNATLTQNELDSLKFTWDKAQILVKVPYANVLKNDNVINEEKGEFYVVLLNGQKYPMRLEHVKTVRGLKQALMQKIEIETRKQKLIFEGVELKEYEKRLIKYGVREGSHVQLIVVLYSITKEVSISNLSFDLHWGFPRTGLDYLDGTCLIYTGNELWKKYDYASPFDSCIPYIRHSGDIIDVMGQRG